MRPGLEPTEAGVLHKPRPGANTARLPIQIGRLAPAANGDITLDWALAAVTLTVMTSDMQRDSLGLSKVEPELRRRQSRSLKCT